MKSKLWIALALLASVSCKKNYSPSGTAALNIVHAMVNVDNIAVNTAANPIPFYRNTAFLGFGSNAEYSLPPGLRPLVIVSSDDTTKTLFSASLTLQSAGIYSLYLAGVAPTVDTVFREDQIPVYRDSSAGIRFINLSPDSNALTINLEGNSPSQTEFPALGYKQISSFKTYPADASVPGYYNFEIWDQVTGVMVTAFSWSYSVQHSHTVVIGGLEANGVSAFAVNNF